MKDVLRTVSRWNGWGFVQPNAMPQVEAEHHDELHPYGLRVAQPRSSPSSDLIHVSPNSQRLFGSSSREASGGAIAGIVADLLPEGLPLCRYWIAAEPDEDVVLSVSLLNAVAV